MTRLVLVGAGVLLLALAAFASNLNYSAAQTTPTVLIDYDLDDDGLIEVRTRLQFRAIHQDLDGDGTAVNLVTLQGTQPDWTTAYPDAMPNAGCPPRDHDNDPATDDVASCIGYELLNDIDYAGNTYHPLGWTVVDGSWVTVPLTAKIVGNGFRIMNPTKSGSYAFTSLISNVGPTGSVEGLGLVNPNFWSQGGNGGGLTWRLSGLVTGSYVEGGRLRQWETGAIAGQLQAGADFAGTIAHSYVRGPNVGQTRREGGLVGEMWADNGTNRPRCLNSYFSGQITANNGNRSRGLLIGKPGGSRSAIENCYGDNTSSSGTSHAWHGASSADNARYTRSKAQLSEPTGYSGPFALWDDYAADGTALEDSVPRSDFWHFGDTNTLPTLKGWGHDHTIPPARALTGADMVNLCDRTLAVANEIIRHLKDDDRRSGVTTTPAEVTALTPCTSDRDTRNVSITNLTDLVVTSASNAFNLSPDRTLPVSDRLTTLDANDFAYLPNAAHFDLGGNDLESIPARLFQGIPLRWLDLSNNKLTTLPADLFAGLAAVTETTGNALLLNGNTLTETGIPERLFDTMGHLNGLDLSDNALTRVNTRWFEALNNLGRKAATSPPYTHALGLHLADNTITEHYYASKLFTGVKENNTAYTGSTAGDALRTAIIAAITAANVSVANLDLASTDHWFNTTSPPAYQASSVTQCLTTQTAGPGRGDYVDGEVPECQIQPHWTPPHKSTDSATATPTITAPTGSRGMISMSVSHTASTAFVAYQVRYRASTADPWTPWQVAPITLAAGTKSITAQALDSGLAHQVELRALSTTGPPSLAATTSITTTAANWLSGFRASTGTTAVGTVALNWNAVNTSSLPTGHAVTGYYYRYKRESATLYGGWRSAGTGTSYIATGLDPGVTFDFQLVGAIDDEDADSTLDYFTNRGAASASPLLAPAGLSAAGGTLPGSINLTWMRQTLATTSQAKFQYRRKLRTGSWSGVAWLDVPDGDDSGPHVHDETGYTVTGLAAGTEYDFQVRLYWDDTLGAQQAIDTSATAKAADAPANLTVTAGSDPGEIDIAWDAQSATSDGMTYYQYRHRVAGGSWPVGGGWTRIAGSDHETDSLSIVATNGNSIEVQVRFYWNGPGTAASTTVTTVAVAEITGLAASAGYDLVTLNWDQQSATTGTQAHYQLRYKKSSQSWPTEVGLGWAAIPGSNHASSSYTVSGLDGGSAYDFQVRFRYSNAAGTSVSAQVSATPSSVVAPFGLTATTSPRLNEIDLSWSAQTQSTASNARFQYRVNWSVGGSWTGWADVPDSTGADGDAGTHTHDEVSYTITGLTFHRLHDVEVRFAIGTAVGPAVRLTNIRAGYQPQGMMATPGVTPGTIDVTWTPQTVYTETWRRFHISTKLSSASAWQSWINIADETSSSYQFTGLTVGANYDIRMMFNTTGEHNWPNTAYIPMLQNVRAGFVKPPTNFTATPSPSTSGAIDLKWDAQTESTAAASKFQYRYKLASTAAWSTETWNDIDDGGTTVGDSDANHYNETGVTVTTGLTAGSTYDFQLRFLWNATHGSSTSVTATATASTVPTPANFTATPGSSSGNVDLSWDVVAGVDKYQYRYTAAGGTYPTTGAGSWADVPDANSNSDSSDESALTISSGLTAGGTYSFQLRSVSGTTNSPPATSVATAQRQAPPTSFTATTGTNPGQIALTWGAPSTGTATRYEYRYKRDDEAAYPSSWRQVPDGSDSGNSQADETAYTITSLWAGVSYNVQLRVVTSTTSSIPNVGTTKTAAARSVAAPTNFTAAMGDEPGEIDVTWTVLASSGLPSTPGTPAVSDAVVRYEYRYKLNSASAYPDSGAGSWAQVPDQDDPADGQADETAYTITGLTAYTAYDVELRGAIHDNDEGTATTAEYHSAPASAMNTRSGLASPANPQAGGGRFPGEISITWTPQTTFGTAFTAAKYQIRYKLNSAAWPSGGGWTDIAGSHRGTFTHVLSGLPVNQLHDIELRFVPNSSLTTAAAMFQATPTAVPVPSGMTAGAASATIAAIDVSWIPQTDGMDTNAKYQIRRKLTSTGDANTGWPAASPYGWADIPDSASDGAQNESETILTGLTAGESYHIELRFHWSNAVGVSAAARATATASTIPAPPNFSASPGSANDSVDLAWGAVTGITKYQYRYKGIDDASFPSTGTGSWADIPDSGSNGLADETSYTVTGLTGGDVYNFELRAHTAATTFGTAAMASAKAQPQAPPTAFTAATGTNPGEIDLSWTVPTGSTHTGFQYRLKRTGQADDAYILWQDVPDSASDGRANETSYTIVSLWAGVRYTVQIRAQSATTESEPGASTTASAKAKEVAAPTGLTTAIGDNPGEIDITWTAIMTGLPSGDTVVQYQYRTKQPAAAWPIAAPLGWVNIPPANTASYTITGLTPGTQHDVQLRAAIADGTEGTAATAEYHSDAVMSALSTYAGLAKPANLRATASETTPGSIVLRWNQQAAFTDPTARYEIRYKPQSTNNWPGTSPFGWSPISGSTHATASHTLTGLMNGDPYDIQLRFYVSTALGSSAATAVVGTATSIAVPTGLMAETSMTTAGAIALEWDPQSAVTVSTATFQVRTRSTAVGSSWSTWAPVPDDTSSADPDTDAHDETRHTVTGLTADQSYDIELRLFMSSAIGASNAATASATASRVPTPQNLDAASGSGAGEIDLSWTALSGITDYQYRYKLESVATYGSWATAGSGTSYTIENLTVGMWYNIQIRARATGVGESPATAAVRAQAQTTAGPATLAFSHGPNPGDIKIDWTAPANNAPKEHYEYRYKLTTAATYPSTGDGAWAQVPDGIDLGTSQDDEVTFTITGLQAGMSYHVEFRVYASSQTGYSLPQRGTQTARPVPPPTAFTATSGTNPGEVNLSWSAPTGVTILRYEIRHRLDTTGAWSGWTSAGTGTTHALTGLPAGMLRTFQLRAVMQTVGASAPVSTTGTPTAVPTPPSFTAMTGVFPGEIDISWMAVTGATSYEYRYTASSNTVWPDDATWQVVAATVTSTAITLLDEGADYTIELRAAIANVGKSTVATASASARDGSFDDGRQNVPAISGYAIDAKTVPGRIAITLPFGTNPFIYRYRTANPGEWSRWFKVTPQAGDTRYVIPSLVAGIEYDIEVRAYTGPGATMGFTTPLTATARGAPLVAPADFAVTESSGAILLQWSSPSIFTPSYYEYRTRPTGTQTWSSWTRVNHEGDQGSTQRRYVTGLESGISHDFELRMVTGTVPSPVASSAGSSRLRIPEVHSIRPTVREVSIRAGDTIVLTVDIYNTQEVLDNSIPDKDGSKLVFRWAEQGTGGGSFADPTDERRVTYTAPSSPGRYTITAEAQPDGVCNSHHEGATEVTAVERAPCIATFTIQVSRAPSPPTPQPDPVDPAGAIPTTMVDDQGGEYTVFTPTKGGTFTGDDITVTAPAGAIPDRTVIGIAAAVSDIEPPTPIPGATMSIAGSFYDINAIADSGEQPIPSYTLNQPATACLPFPDEFRADLSNVVLVQRKSTGDLSILSTKIRSRSGDLTVCGTLSQLPATIAVARLGLVPAPTPTTPSTPAGTPDTGATTPGYAVLLISMLLGVLILTGMHRIRRMTTRG